GGLIAFSAAANQLAPQTGTETSVFSRELGLALRMPGLSLRTALFRVREQVRIDSAGQQFPAVYEQLLDDFALVSVSGDASSSNTIHVVDEREVWETIKNSEDSAILETFIRQFPEGRFKSDATVRL